MTVADMIMWQSANQGAKHHVGLAMALMVYFACQGI